MVGAGGHECLRLWRSFALDRPHQLDAGSRLQAKVSNAAASKQCFQEVLSRAGLGGQSCESGAPSHEVVVVSIFDGHFVFDSETISANGFSISSFALFLSLTHLYLLLAQSD